MTTIVVFAGALLTFACAGIGIQGFLSHSRRRMRGRVESVRRRWAGGAPVPVAHASVKRNETSANPGLERFAKRFLPNQAELKRRLARTGRDIPLGTYLLANLAVAVGTGVVVAAVFGPPTGLVLLVAAGAGLALPHMVIGRMGAKRLARFGAIFPEAIDLMVRGLKSGLPITESLNAVGREMADPVGLEFRRIADNVKFGQSLEEALWEAAGRLDTPAFKFFVISLSVQRETGGNLGETLANLSDILRRRRRMRLKIKAMSSEARASAYILGSLPFIMFAILLMLNYDYEMTLFTDPRGLMMVGGGLTILTMGIAVMAKMVRFEI